MTITQSIILGIIQGFTEFLPISSSGHLILLPKFFGWEDHSLSLDVFLHLGTLLAVIYFFRKDLIKITKSFFIKESKEYRNLGLVIILGTIPAGILGYFFSDLIELRFRSVGVVTLSLLFWAVIMYLSERYHQKLKLKEKKITKINWRKGLFIGFAQAIALIPGTSRSGITITAGLFSKLDRQTAARFSFLLGIPIIAGAGLLKTIEMFQEGVDINQLLVLAVGFLTALISGLIAIKFLLKLIQKYSYNVFVLYRVLLVFFVLALFYL